MKFLGKRYSHIFNQEDPCKPQTPSPLLLTEIQNVTRKGSRGEKSPAQLQAMVPRTRRSSRGHLSPLADTTADKNDTTLKRIKKGNTDSDGLRELEDIRKRLAPMAVVKKTGGYGGPKVQRLRGLRASLLDQLPQK